MNIVNPYRFGSNIYDTAECIFSLHQFVSGTGVSVCRVRDSGDDSEADYTQADADAGFTAIGADNGFLVKLYDQIGTNGHGDLVQATTSLQPKVLNSGTGYINNSKAYVKFDNTDLYLDSENEATPLLDQTSNHTVYIVFKSQAASGVVDGVFEEFVTSNTTRRVAMFSDTSTNKFNTVFAASGAANVLNNTAAISTATIYQECYKRDGANITVYLNGTEQETVGFSNAFPSNTKFRLGKSTAAGQIFAGECTAILIFPEAHDDTTRNIIEADLISTFGI